LLAAGPGITYISEPLNVHHRPGVFRARVANWYTYICAENEQEYLPSYRRLLAYRYDALAEIASLRSGRDAARMGRDLTVLLRGRLGRHTTLLKDPFAIFSLRWFAEVLNCRIVATVRHPAAFASGLKRLNWSFDFGDLLRQPLLMRDLLERHRRSMESDLVSDVIGQAGLLWAIIYGTLHDLRRRYRGFKWFVTRTWRWLRSTVLAAPQATGLEFTGGACCCCVEQRGQPRGTGAGPCALRQVGQPRQPSKLAAAPHR
jgi:hypothetical protein